MEKMEKNKSFNIDKLGGDFIYKTSVKEALKKRKKYIREALKKQGLDLECYEWNHEIKLNIINFLIDYSEKEKKDYKSEMEKKLDKINYLIENNLPQDFEQKLKAINTRAYLELMMYKILLKENATQPIFAINELNIDKLLEEIFEEEKRQELFLKNENIFFERVIEERKIKYLEIINTYLENQKYVGVNCPQFNILLSNHQKIATQFLEKLLEKNKNIWFLSNENIWFLSNNKKGKKNKVIWNEKLLTEIYDFLSFSLENIYSAKLNEKNRMELLVKLKVSLLKLKINIENEVEILIKELSEKNIYDEWYYHLYFFLSLDYLFEEKKEISEKKEMDNTESEDYINRIKFKEQIVENLADFKEIKYKVLECSRKQPNDYKERMLNIESLITDMKSKEVGVIFPRIEEINILLYYILYLDSKFKYRGNTLLYWMKVFIKNNQKLDNEEEYLYFLRYVNLIIKEKMFKVCNKENEYKEVLEIKKIVKELLMLLVNVPTIDGKNRFLVKILVELRNNQGANLNSVTSVINSF
ncbi:MAG: hypothetical protein ACRDA0_03410 [Cetobacterium sp.]|uniref:hypothetical protein n=1 Tax=Cetobacterium sp. TaxID=2071632 RepID=UPI003F2A5B22